MLAVLVAAELMTVAVAVQRQWQAAEAALEVAAVAAAGAAAGAVGQLPGRWRWCQ